MAEAGLGPTAHVPVRERQGLAATLTLTRPMHSDLRPPRPTHMTLPESRSVLTRRMVRPTARSMSGRRPKGIGQTRPNKRKAAATTATENGGGTSSGAAGTPESTGSPSTSSSPDTCTSNKRGRPADTPVQKFEKRAKNAQRIYERGGRGAHLRPEVL